MNKKILEVLNLSLLNLFSYNTSLILKILHYILPLTNLFEFLLK